MVRSNAPALVQRSFYSESWSTGTRSSWPVGRRRATGAPASSGPRRQRTLSMRWMIGPSVMTLMIERQAGRCRRRTLAAPARLDSAAGMVSHRPRAATAPDPPLIPPALAASLSVFRSCFTAPVWNHIQVLVAGAVLASGMRTVTRALRVMGLGQEPRFRRYHEMLGRACRDSKVVARRLLLRLLNRLLTNGPVVIGIDDNRAAKRTDERRCGPRIKTRGIYRPGRRRGLALPHRRSEADQVDRGAPPGMCHCPGGLV